MPEGDVIKKHEKRWQSLISQPLTFSSPQGRFAAEADLLQDKRLTAVDAHGKHLFLHFEEHIVHIHLGLYGRFTYFKNVPPEPKTTVRFRVKHADGAIDLSGPTRCQLITLEEKEKVHERLGIDPYRDKNIDELLPWLKTSKAPVGKTLMDQNRIAGIGNVYRADLLFFHQLNPHTLNKDISEETWRKLWSTTIEMFKASLIRGGNIWTTNVDSPKPDHVGERPTSNRCYVYKRTGQPCFACLTPIEQSAFYGRTIYWCPQCQK